MRADQNLAAQFIEADSLGNVELARRLAFTTTPPNRESRFRRSNPADRAPWHVHDLRRRRTLATNLGKLGVDRITMAKILN